MWTCAQRTEEPLVLTRGDSNALNEQLARDFVRQNRVDALLGEHVTAGAWMSSSVDDILDDLIWWSERKFARRRSEEERFARRRSPILDVLRSLVGLRPVAPPPADLERIVDDITRECLHVAERIRRATESYNTLVDPDQCAALISRIERVAGLLPCFANTATA